jgi:lipid A 3-O-deacylase
MIRRMPARDGMRLFRRVALLIAVSAPQASAQRWVDAPRSFTLQEENDAFGTGKSDNDYTQGLRLAYDFAVWNKHWDSGFRWQSLLALGELLGARVPSIARSCADGADLQRRPCGTVAVSIGQTEYTPTDLVDTELVPTERPYAGYLWLGFARTALFRRGQVTSEVDVGFVGPPAVAKEAQSLAHWTWASNRPQPQGWGNQLGLAPHLSLINQYAYRVAERCGRRCDGTYDEARWFDLAPRVSLTAGSLMTRASFGATARLGYRMPETLARQTITISRSTAATKDERRSPGWWRRRQPWVMAIASLDEHVVGHNTLLSGSWVDIGPGEWREQRQIETLHHVREHSYGMGAGVNEATFIWQWVTRGAEYRPASGKHRYGSITISIHQPAR